jgi:hypothetical protein
MRNDCRNCDFNTYKNINEHDWVSCCHPITIAKSVKWEPGDPAFVNYRTADVSMSDIQYMADCPTWAPRFPDVCGFCGGAGESDE